jgi:two-component system LytT family response regulator
VSVPIRVLVAEDEPAARKLLATLLGQRADVAVVAEAGSGPAAVAAIRAHAPDVVFLDVRMPGLDGFGVVEAIGPANMPAVVFVTAYDEYAVRAFDIQAVDYLLKPFDRERLDRAVGRAVQHVRRGSPDELAQRLAELLDQLKRGRGYLRRIPVKSEGRVRFLDTDRVDWIEADGKMVRLHAGKEVHVMRQPLAGLLTQLDPARFVRVHRSAAVNVERVQELQPWFQGDHVLILRDGTRVTTGRQYRDGVRRLLGET